MNIEEEGNPAPFPADLQVFPFFQTGPPISGGKNVASGGKAKNIMHSDTRRFGADPLRIGTGVFQINSRQADFTQRLLCDCFLFTALLRFK